MNRFTVSSLVVSAAALIGIAVSEGYRGEAYVPVKGDVATIGFGSTGGVKMGDKTTPERALITLLKDVDHHANGIKACIQVPLYQREFDAYTSLAFNIGVNAFCKSTLVNKLNTGDYAGACAEILRWDKFQGKPLRGLTLRRQAEYKTCIGKP